MLHFSSKQQSTSIGNLNPMQTLEELIERHVERVNYFKQILSDGSKAPIQIDINTDTSDEMEIYNNLNQIERLTLQIIRKKSPIT